MKQLWQAVASKLRHNIWDFQAVFSTCHNPLSSKPPSCHKIFELLEPAGVLEFFLWRVTLVVSSLHHPKLITVETRYTTCSSEIHLHPSSKANLCGHQACIPTGTSRPGARPGRAGSACRRTRAPGGATAKACSRGSSHTCSCRERRARCSTVLSTTLLQMHAADGTSRSRRRLGRVLR